MSGFPKILLMMALTGGAAVWAQEQREAIATGTTVPLMGRTTAVPGPQSTVGDELRQMSAQAGVIFAGEVLAVRPSPAAAMGTGWVEVEFRIDQAIRGCLGQATYVLREWAGLWAGGRQRYRAGQRLLVLLHAPSASGLSSPVGGQDGIIPITGMGAAPRENDAFVSVSEQAVDLRWLETRLLRAGGERLHARPLMPAIPAHAAHQQVPFATRKASPLASNAGAEQSLQGVLRTVASGNASLNMETPGQPSSLQVTATQGITLRSVLAMLSVWESEQNHAGH